jgi:C-terminal processing protease CtpA/Prc
MQRCRKLSLVIFFCIVFNEIRSQWIITSNRSAKESVLDLVPFAKSFAVPGEFAFFGHAEKMGENVVTSGVNPFSYKYANPALTGSEKTLIWQIGLKKPVNFNEGQPILFYINLYTRNVGSITVWIHYNKGYWAGKDVTIKNEKYTGPIEFAFNGKEIKVVADMQLPAEETTPAKLLESHSGIDSVLLVINKKDKQLQAESIVGECMLFQRKNEDTKAKAMFFYDFTGDEGHKPNNVSNTSFGTAYPLSRLVSYVDFTSPFYNFIPDTAYDKPRQEKAFFDLIGLVFKKYPYYKEHRLDSMQFKIQLEKIIATAGDFNAKLLLLQSLVRQFHDGHFRLDIGGEEKKILGAIAARSFKNGVFVSAVFDESVKAKIAPGMKITAINTMPVDQYIDSLARYEYGDSLERVDLSVSRLFYGKTNDSVQLRLVDSTGIVSTARLTYSGKVSAPERFRPKNFHFFTTKDQWGYLRINSWTMGNWVSFFNLGDTLKTLKGIIFDLRGNPGGAEIEPMRVASCFLKQPIPYALCLYGSTPSNGANTLIPNKFLNLSWLKVKILVDHKTACASEQFINVLKLAVGATVIGARPTAGCYSNAAYFYFPGNVVLTTNVMQKTFLNERGKTIEFSGIKPDYLVTLSSYKDLFGYDDKILKEALEK